MVAQSVSRMTSFQGSVCICKKQISGQALFWEKTAKIKDLPFPVILDSFRAQYSNYFKSVSLRKDTHLH